MFKWTREDLQLWLLDWNIHRNMWFICSHRSERQNTNHSDRNTNHRDKQVVLLFSEAEVERPSWFTSGLIMRLQLIRELLSEPSASCVRLSQFSWLTTEPLISCQSASRFRLYQCSCLCFTHTVPSETHYCGMKPVLKLHSCFPLTNTTTLVWRCETAVRTHRMILV